MISHPITIQIISLPNIFNFAATEAQYEKSKVSFNARLVRHSS